MGEDKTNYNDQKTKIRKNRRIKPEKENAKINKDG